MGKKVAKCYICKKKIGLSFREKMKLECAKIPEEQKQKFLDLFLEGKKNLGEASKEAGIDSTAAMYVLNQKIKTKTIKICHIEYKGKTYSGDIF